MKPLRQLGRWLAREDFREALDANQRLVDLAMEHYDARVDAQAAAVAMLDGIDVGQAHIEVTRTIAFAPRIRITYGDHLMFDGEAMLPRLDFKAPPSSDRSSNQ